MSDDVIYLHAESLWSKWGFNDGDCPDEVMNALEERGIDYGDFDWHARLSTLVLRHIVPLLDGVESADIVEVHTIHNPIRHKDWFGVSYGDASVPERYRGVSVAVPVDVAVGE
jgi:hypothetical protein